MDVIAFVGPSGTGKSHRALLVAHNTQSDAIIDDGLYIKDGKAKILLGVAKGKKNYDKKEAIKERDIE